MIDMTYRTKIAPHHLERTAGVYVRQSSMQQVRQHTASTRLQYDLRTRAVEFGWRKEQLRVYDGDQGISGGGTAERPDFDQLVSDVGLGRMGIVLAFDATMLARNNADWHRLLDLCGICDTLVADLDGVYDVAQYNDRLLLGLKGTMSEAEHHLIRTRMKAGMEKKAQDGSLRKRLPVGLVYDDEGRVQLNPDERVRRAITLVLEKFRELGTGHAVYRYLQEENVHLPVRRYKWTIIEWHEATYDTVHGILSNPRYAGAYVYGRTKVVRSVDEHSRIREQRVTVPASEWRVIRRDQHPGYLSWDEYEENLSRLEKNNLVHARGEGSEVLRNGRGLLQGLLRCGVCGRRMTTCYAKKGDKVRYDCAKRSRVVDGQGVCQSVGGSRLEAAVVEALLTALEPASMAIALAALDEIDREHDAVLHQLEAQLTEARYHAERAFRQYDAVEPEHRNVVRNLELQWNQRLAEAEKIEERIEERKRHKPDALSDDEKRRILELGVDVRRIWEAPTTEHRARKQILQTAFEAVFVTVDREARQANLKLTWEGGQTSDLAVPIPNIGYHTVVTPAEVIEDIRKMATCLTDKQIARTLWSRGLRTATGLTFDVRRVRSLRKQYGIPRYQEDPDCKDGEVYTAAEAAEKLGVCVATILRWLEDGFLIGEQVAPHAPWRIRIPESSRLRVADKTPAGWVSTKKAAFLLGVGRRSVLHWVRAERVSAVISGRGLRRGIRVNLVELERVVKQTRLEHCDEL
jgi:DNA invertase Pin-like site-specific DNA recombinase